MMLNLELYIENNLKIMWFIKQVIRAGMDGSMFLDLTDVMFEND